MFSCAIVTWYFLVKVILTTPFLISFPEVKLVSQIVSIYFILLVVRAAIAMITFPFLKQVGLNFDWRKSMIVIWAGIRAPVILMCAMILVHKNNPYFELEPRYERVEFKRIWNDNGVCKNVWPHWSHWYTEMMVGAVSGGGEGGVLQVRISWICLL